MLSDSERLPIYRVERNLIEAACPAGSRTIVQAPTGSGKSTQVPQILLRDGSIGTGEILVLQPRRLAARLLAQRVSREMGSPLGGLVGYQVRFESKVSRETRIKFVTEGILLRRLVDDPTLVGVAAVLFDEFHERHLYGDVSLGRSLLLQRTVRPDLKLLVMSATLDTVGLESFLAPCHTISSEGRTFPVDQRFLRKMPARDDLCAAAAAETAELVLSSAEGNALVFMPGAWEIRRTIDLLRPRLAGTGIEIHALHGELPVEDQDRAVDESGRRRVIVSTNIAETSITIQGVRFVIDSGLARIAGYDPRRGINTLLIEKISRASAAQRAGRAGRTGPGISLALWTEKDHAARPGFEAAEVHRLDLAEVVLALRAGGIHDLDAFPWVENPDPEHLKQADRLLHDLGAVDGRGRVTGLGGDILAFPVHPRLGRVLVEGAKLGCLPAAAGLAALTQGRGIFLRSRGADLQKSREAFIEAHEENDLLADLHALAFAERFRFSVDSCARAGLHAVSARQAAQLAERLERAAASRGFSVSERDPVTHEKLARCVLSGFSDHLACRQDRGTLRCSLVGGRRGTLARESLVQSGGLFVATEISEIEGRDAAVTTLLTSCCAVEEDWVREAFPEDFSNEETVALDPGTRRVTRRIRRTFRDLVLEDRESGETTDSEAAVVLAAEVLAGRCQMPQWDEAVETWIRRVNLLAVLFPEYGIAELTEKDRPFLIEQICLGARSFRAVRRQPIWPIIHQWLAPEQAAALEHHLPERYLLPSGRRAPIRYEAEPPPVLSARIQDLYGLEGTLSVAEGRQRLKIEVLALNQRPIQVTEDLSSFWRETYPVISRPGRPLPR
ncbi:MAG: ATP-dependent helicase HrpB [Opitutaceae bacterium]